VEERRFSAAIASRRGWALARVVGSGVPLARTTSGAKARIHFQLLTRPWKGRSSTAMQAVDKRDPLRTAGKRRREAVLPR
jgi:hypothetical protein